MKAPEIITFAALNDHIRTLEQPTIIAIDGRSGSGKTTFAKQLSHAVNATLVYSDDVAWHHSFFDWWDLLIENILEPFKAGKNVDYTPEAWKNKGRAGSILVTAAPVLILEGVSCTRLDYSHWIDLPIWVETNPKIAEERGLLRDGQAGRDFWFEWQAVERPLLEKDQPWTRAKLVVDGASSLEYDPNLEFVAITNQLTRN